MISKNRRKTSAFILGGIILGPVPIWKPVVFQAVLLALTALMTVLESAAELISDNRLERLSDEGEIRAVKLRARLDRIETALPSIQMAAWAVTFMSGFLGAVGFIGPVYAWAAQPWMGTAAMAGIVVLICLLTQILGIGLPRRLAAVQPDQLALSMFTAVELAGKLFSPLYRIGALVVRGILCLIRVDINETTEKVTEDEIMAMVDMGEEKGAIETNEKEMIENIFEFNNKTAEECMTHRTDVTAINVECTEEEVVSIIEETGLSRYPVYGKDLDDIIGVISARSYLLNIRSAQPKRIRELARPAYFVPESVKTDTLFREMQTRKTHMAIVVDEYGGTSGLITLEDLLEEIVGDIYDEFDPQAETDIAELPDGGWRAAGSLSLDKLCDVLELDSLDNEEYDTLGGLVFSQLTEIPEDGSHPEVECFGLHIRVEEMSDRRVEWAIVRKIETAEEETEE